MTVAIKRTMTAACAAADDVLLGMMSSNSPP